MSIDLPLEKFNIRQTKQNENNFSLLISATSTKLEK